jgi:hypothetical protein
MPRACVKRVTGETTGTFIVVNKWQGYGMVMERFILILLSLVCRLQHDEDSADLHGLSLGWESWTHIVDFCKVAYTSISLLGCFSFHRLFCFLLLLFFFKF